MRRKFGLVVLIVCVLASSGCSTVLKYDQQNIREAMLDLYTEQIMDNLIRAKNGYPILQVDYKSVTGQITNQEQITLGGSRGSDSTRYGRIPDFASAPVVAAFSPVKVISKTFTYLFDAYSNQQLSINAEPVINNKAVYLPYLDFLAKRNKETNMDSLREQYTKPDPGQCHMGIYKKFDGKYYYVPKAFAKDFLTLALAVMSIGTETVKLKLYYETEIVDVVMASTTDNGTSYDVILELKDDIPYGMGKVIIPVDGFKSPFPLIIDPKRLKKQKPDQNGQKEPENIGITEVNTTPPVELVSTITIQYVPSDNRNIALNDFVKTIEGKAVRVMLENHQPEAASTEDLLRAIRYQVELIRLNQSVGTR